VGQPKEVSDGTSQTIDYTDFGKEVHEIYAVMVNTSSGTDDYKVTVAATGS
jgi:hypothetical protein